MDENDFTKKVRKVSHDEDVVKTIGGTEAGFFHRALKIPTVIIGPGTTSMAHVADEYLKVDVIERYIPFLKDTVHIMCD
ncbi:hypothetical protein AGDE_15876 [Angomonas deanei]|nr:hypothetical protein AGDE_15876 [Angomonas deanei]|eukprot:EPY18220.1 hypothetical protein AGDE_15876 [Angomonas deanei]